MAETSADSLSPSSPDQSNTAGNKRGKLLLGLALLAALALYLPSVWFGVIYDDRILLMNNPQLHSWSNVPYFFTHHMWTNIDPSRGKYYRPLVMTVFIAISKLFGVQIWAFHLSSVVLFLLTVAAVWFAAREFGLSPTGAGWTAMLFAVHPIHIEVVAWATGQSDTIAALPFILALACYRRAQRLGRWAWFLAALVAYVLALLAKESVVILPLLAILIEILWRADNAGKQKYAVIRIATLFTVTAAYLIARTAVLGEVAGSQPGISWKMALLTIPSLLMFYLRQLLLPLNVSLFYDSDYVMSAGTASFLLPLFIVAALLAIFVFCWKRHTLNACESFCILAALLCLAPILNLRVFPWREFAHDRYIYLSSIFFAIALVSLVSRLARAKTLILVGVALFLAIQCEAQVWIFKDEFSLFSQAIRVAPNNTSALGRMAILLYQRGDHADAKTLLHRVILLSPKWYDPHFDLAQMEMQDGNFPEAEQQLRAAIAIIPQRTEPHGLLAEILEREGRPAEAEEERRLARQALMR